MTLLMPKRRRRAAFTLIELMVVMAILTIMISLLLAGVNRVRLAAKRTNTHTEIRELGQGITMFKQKFSVDYVPSKIVLRERLNYNFADAVEMASHNWLREAWPHLAPQTASNASPFPPGTIPGTHGIDWNCDGQIADFYDEWVDNLVKSLISLLEPIMIVFLGFTIGAIVISLFLPLIKLLEGLSK